MLIIVQDNKQQYKICMYIDIHLKYIMWKKTN